MNAAQQLPDVIDIGMQVMGCRRPARRPGGGMELNAFAENIRSLTTGLDRKTRGRLLTYVTISAERMLDWLQGNRVPTPYEQERLRQFFELPDGINLVKTRLSVLTLANAKIQARGRRLRVHNARTVLETAA